MNKRNNAYIECFFCHETGHVKQECPKYLDWRKKLKKNQKEGRKRERARATLQEDSESGEDSSSSTEITQSSLRCYKTTNKNELVFRFGSKQSHNQ